MNSWNNRAPQPFRSGGQPSTNPTLAPLGAGIPQNALPSLMELNVPFPQRPLDPYTILYIHQLQQQQQQEATRQLHNQIVSAAEMMTQASGEQCPQVNQPATLEAMNRRQIQERKRQRKAAEHKKVMCQAMLDNGRCNYGNRCKFAHSTTEMQGAVLYSASLASLPPTLLQQPTGGAACQSARRQFPNSNRRTSLPATAAGELGAAFATLNLSHHHGGQQQHHHNRRHRGSLSGVELDLTRCIEEEIARLDDAGNMTFVDDTTFVGDRTMMEKNEVKACDWPPSIPESSSPTCGLLNEQLQGADFTGLEVDPFSRVMSPVSSLCSLSSNHPVLSASSTVASPTSSSSARRLSSVSSSAESSYHYF